MDGLQWAPSFSLESAPDYFTSSLLEVPACYVSDKVVNLEPVQSQLPSLEIPTPPSLAHSGLPFQTPEEWRQDLLRVPHDPVISVSTMFHPNAALLPIPTDLIFVSSDNVLFYVHTTQVLSLTDNHFNDLVPRNQPHFSDDRDLFDKLGAVRVPEAAAVFNIIMHATYDIQCARYHPDIHTLVAAVDAMATYGLSLKRHIASSTPLYALILGLAPTQPMLVYALAASHDLHELAVQVSTHLLSFSLADLTDELAARIGPVYLKRLFFLHLGRLDVLKKLLQPPPHPHPSTEGCDFKEQKKLTRAWELAAAYLAWDARPDLAASAIQNALCPLTETLECEMCKDNLNSRIRQLVVQWSVVKRSI